MLLSQRNVRSKVQWLTELCNSHYVSQFAAFFIDTRAERSTVESRINFFSFWDVLEKWGFVFVLNSITHHKEKRQRDIGTLSEEKTNKQAKKKKGKNIAFFLFCLCCCYSFPSKCLFVVILFFCDENQLGFVVLRFTGLVPFLLYLHIHIYAIYISICT